VITEAVFNKVPYEKLLKIKETTLDLSNSMDWIARQIAPQAVLTYDRFHVQKIVSEAVQEMRIKYRWKAIDEENENILKH
jgi:transposase